jgi:hypothetical protein
MFIKYIINKILNDNVGAIVFHVKHCGIYSPPLGDNVNYTFEGSYSAPDGDDCDFDFC